MPRIISDKSAGGWLRTQARTARKWLLLSIALGVAGGLLIVAQAWLISRIVDAVFGPEAGGMPPAPLFISLVAVIFLKAGTSWGREISGFKAGAAVRGQIRRDLLAHLFAAGPVAISRLPAGRLVSSALEQVEAIQNFVARYLPQMALAALLPLVILVYVFPISWAAGGILLATAPLIPLFMVLVGMGAESISQRHFQALARMSAHFLDVLRGLTTLKLFGRSKAQATQIEAISSQYRRRTMAVLRVAFLSSAVLEFFSAIAIALVAVYLGTYYLGYLHFGAYGRPINFAAGFFILLLAPDFFLPLRELGTHYHARADAVGAAEEILKVFQLPRLTASGTSGREKVGAPALIRFESVTVTYGIKGRRGIDAIDLIIRKGEKVALVGESGAGKSTLIHLLMGFIQPTSGRILIDDVPLTELATASWRNHLAWIGQNPMLFCGSLRENIALAWPDADDGQIELAARRAGVMAFAAGRKAGLSSEVGEQGHGLSAGQAQRVALARAFLKEAPVLLLDEPTAGLDGATEHEILADLRRWSRDRTVLMATHRPAALPAMDRIIILSDGRILAQGGYEALRRTHGRWLPGEEKENGRFER